MLVACLGVGGGFAPRVVNPMLGPWPGALVLLGAKNTALIVYRGQVMRLLGPMLLHAGWVHLGMNVFIQLRLGLYLELRWGWRRWLEGLERMANVASADDRFAFIFGSSSC